MTSPGARFVPTCDCGAPAPHADQLVRTESKGVYKVKCDACWSHLSDQERGAVPEERKLAAANNLLPRQV